MVSMKKLLVVSVLLLALTNSCKQETTVDLVTADNSVASMADLSKEVNALSVNALDKADVSEPRGFWSFIGNVCKVVVADATGAATGFKVGGIISPTGGFIGAGVVGVSSSISKAVDVWGPKKVDNHLSSVSKSSSEGVYLDELTGGQYGKLHNRAMRQVVHRKDQYALLEYSRSTLCEEEVDTAWREMRKEVDADRHSEVGLYSYSSTRDDNEENSKDKYIPPYGDKEVEIFVSHDFGDEQESCQESFRRVETAMENIDTELDLVMSLEKNLGFSREEASIMKDITVTLSKLPLTSVQDYISGIEGSVNHANISADQKENLSVFISVAFSSRLLWDGLE